MRRIYLIIFLYNSTSYFCDVISFLTKPYINTPKLKIPCVCVRVCVETENSIEEKSIKLSEMLTVIPHTDINIDKTYHIQMKMLPQNNI